MAVSHYKPLQRLDTYQQKSTKNRSLPATYAQAVTNITSTVLKHGTEERTAEEVEIQVTETLQENLGVKRMTRIRNGVNVVCENAEGATKVRQMSQQIVKILKSTRRTSKTRGLSFFTSPKQ